MALHSQNGAVSGYWTTATSKGADSLIGAPAHLTKNPLCQQLISRLAVPFHGFPMYRQWRAPKRIQALMGHSSINVTMDVYGHLMPQGGMR